jgi:beta-lactam-binding protein with PASTA domain
VETRAAREGTILRQSPAPRTMVKCGSPIDIAVAVMPPNDPPFDPARGGPEPGRGAPPVTECPAPSLTNYSVADVRERLRGWTIGRVQKVETRAAQEGTILRQSPAPRTMVKCGSAIDIAVAVAPPIVAPPPPCVVPVIESGDVASARQALARRNLVLGNVNARPSEKSPGTVIGQNPAPESTIACGSAIDVWIATPLPLVRVPALQGQDAATATRTLEGVGLVLGTADRREAEFPAGGVVEQLPAPGTEVRRGTPVNVWLSSGLPLTPIPDVRGRDRGTAAEILRSLQFRLGEVLERASDATPGTIVDQQPQAGTQSRRDTPVRVWVSAAIEVPSVIGRRQADATAILTNQRLRVGAVSTRESTEPAGTVIDQQPQPRRPVRLNAPVDLVLAIPVTVLVPDLRGRDRQGATSVLTSAGLQLGEATTREADEPAGLVIEQSPRAGERVEIGTAVQVSVAVPVRVEVPSLIGKPEGEALALLKNRRLRVGQVQTREAAGTRGAILDQRPRAGQQVDAGSAIDLTVATAITIVVPDLRGTTRDDSGNLLRLRGLVLGSVETRVSGGFPGTIVEQQPPPGARVEAGTPVAIRVAAPAPPELIPPQVITSLEVPDLKGRTREQALAILADRGLVLGQAGTILSTDTPDTVVSQQPAGFSRVLPGTNVDVVLASPPSPVSDAGAVVPPPANRPWNAPMPLVWLLLGAGLGAASAAITVRAKTRAAREPRDVPPSITFAPHPDPEMRVELSADGPFTRSELWLRPCRDSGSQTIHGSGPLGMVEVMETR